MNMIIYRDLLGENITVFIAAINETYNQIAAINPLYREQMAEKCQNAVSGLTDLEGLIIAADIGYVDGPLEEDRLSTIQLINSEDLVPVESKHVSSVNRFGWFSDASRRGIVVAFAREAGNDQDILISFTDTILFLSEVNLLPQRISPGPMRLDFVMDVTMNPDEFSWKQIIINENLAGRQVHVSENCRKRIGSPKRKLLADIIEKWTGLKLGRLCETTLHTQRPELLTSLKNVQMEPYWI
jgi:hypothetical protein